MTNTEPASYREHMQDALAAILRLKEGARAERIAHTNCTHRRSDPKASCALWIGAAANEDAYTASANALMEAMGLISTEDVQQMHEAGVAAAEIAAMVSTQREPLYLYPRVV